MKKIIKISCIVVISILVLWLSLYLVDNARYRKGDKPLFTLKTKNYLFFDGKVTEYDSLLYKIRISVIIHRILFMKMKIINTI